MDLSHASRAEEAYDLVVPETRAGGQRHWRPGFVRAILTLARLRLRPGEYVWCGSASLAGLGRPQPALHTSPACVAGARGSAM
jgi:hypothetical protein